MAVGMLQELEGVTLDQYDQVNATMGIADNPVDGLIVHTAGAMDGGVRIFDIWESREAIDRFTEERLMPAVQQVMGEGGGPPPREPTIYDLHNVVGA
jgi:hypothetical protein